MVFDRKHPDVLFMKNYNGETPRERIIDESCDYTPDAIEGRKSVFLYSPRKGGKSWMNARLLGHYLKQYMEEKMTEQFKTKYHALAWAAEDEKNIFVDSAGMSFRVIHGNIMRQCASDDIWNSVPHNAINQPCRKAEPKEKCNLDLAAEIWEKQSGLHGKYEIAAILDECDKRYARK